MDYCLVSIIINNYNYERFLRVAIDSALNQTYPYTEVIVVDDGSTDNSQEIIASYKNQVIPVLKENGGQASALNAGFAASQGDIIGFLDSDDVWFPHKVARVVEALQHFPEVGWVRHKLEVSNEELCSTGVTIPTFRGSHPIPPNPYLYLERVVNVSTSALILKRNLALQLFPIPEQVFGKSGAALETEERTAPGTWGDADVYLNLSSGTAGGVGYSLDEVLGYYRRHQSQQFANTTDVTRLLKCQIDLGRVVSAIWSEQMGVKRTAMHVYKHSLIVSFLEERSLWGIERWSILIKGLDGAITLFPKSSKLAVRQTVALLFAFITPQLWLKRLLQSQGFEA